MMLSHWAIFGLGAVVGIWLGVGLMCLLSISSSRGDYYEDLH